MVAERRRADEELEGAEVVEVREHEDDEALVLAVLRDELAEPETRIEVASWYRAAATRPAGAPLEIEELVLGIRPGGGVDIVFAGDLRLTVDDARFSAIVDGG